jgi:hypothetical protein
MGPRAYERELALAIATTMAVSLLGILSIYAITF